MRKKHSLLILGCANEEVRVLEAYLRSQPWHDITTAYTQPGEPVAWPGEGRHFDFVLWSLGEDRESALAAALERTERPAALLVIGPAGDAQAMRMAMRMGARDYLSLPLSFEEVGGTLQTIALSLAPASSHVRPQITTVINAKGGAGGSFVATNLAHIMVSNDQLQTALLDFDMQFGVQPLNLDLTLNHSLSEVVSSVDRLDAVALRGYMAKHSSGVYVLGEKLENVILPGELKVDQVARLMTLSTQSFDQVVIDLPRYIDPLFSAVVTKSHHIVLVMQQTLAHVRDAKRLLMLLAREFDVAPEQIVVVINRYQEKASITAQAIAETIGHSELQLLHNDYRRAAVAMDTATPLNESAPAAQLTKDLLALSRHLRRETDSGERKSLLRRALGGLFR